MYIIKGQPEFLLAVASCMLLVIKHANAVLQRSRYA
jgi:hypothetical protein